jgi:hypothetical protein
VGREKTALCGRALYVRETAGLKTLSNLSRHIPDSTVISPDLRWQPAQTLAARAQSKSDTALAKT